MSEFTSETPEELIEEKITSKIIPFLKENINSIDIGKELLQSLSILAPLASGWSAIMNAEAEITIYGITKVKIINMKAIQATQSLLYKNEFIAHITLNYNNDANITKVLNKETLFALINQNICPKCKNPKDNCTCFKTNPDLSNEMKVSSDIFEISHFLETKDESGIFSKKEVTYAIPNNKIEEIIDGLNKSLGFNKKDLFKKASEILQKNPDINENDFATSLISKIGTRHAK